jgi:DNA-binding HxlR family transcriptional regulator
MQCKAHLRPAPIDPRLKFGFAASALSSLQKWHTLNRPATSQKKMTTSPTNSESGCPAEALLKQLAGKWKPQLFRLAAEGPLRFNSLLRQLPGASRQSLAVALKELEAEGLLDRAVIQAKPLHVAYTLSKKGHSLLPIFQQLEHLG